MVSSKKDSVPPASRMFDDKEEEDFGSKTTVNEESVYWLKFSNTWTAITNEKDKVLKL